MAYAQELSLARAAAQKAGEIQVAHRLQSSDIIRKADMSPVTPVDMQCENLIRDTLLSAFPDDGFSGEETEVIQGRSGRRWLVDPLDGTRPYIRGINTFSVLISLEVEDELVLGCAYFPGLRETYWAQTGEGAFCNNTPIHVSKTPDLSHVMGSCLGIIEHLHTREGERLCSFVQQWDYIYGFMDAYSYMCIASGKLDICISLIDKPWDRAAAACIVTEAGGRYSDLFGNRSIGNDSFVVSNGILHETIIAHFSE